MRLQELRSGRQSDLQERTPAAGVVVRESARLNARAHDAQHSMPIILFHLCGSVLSVICCAIKRRRHPNHIHTGTAKFSISSQPLKQLAFFLPAKLDDPEGAGSGRQRDLQERTPADGVVVRESARLNARAHPAQHSMIPGDLNVRSKRLGTTCV